MSKLLISVLKLGVIVFLGANWLPAQGQSLPSSQHAKRFTWSLTYSVKDDLLPEGFAYSPVLFLGQYQFARLGPFDAYLEGQFAGVTTFDGREGDYEFGFNLGIRYQRPLLQDLHFTASLGSGPYWVTVDTGRQADGFIFSDNLDMGLSYHLPETRTQFQLRGRYRHISNAGLQEPNGGIDNFFLIFGFGWRM